MLMLVFVSSAIFQENKPFLCQPDSLYRFLMTFTFFVCKSKGLGIVAANMLIIGLLVFQHIVIKDNCDL